MPLPDYVVTNRQICPSPSMRNSRTLPLGTPSSRHDDRSLEKNVCARNRHLTGLPFALDRLLGSAQMATRSRCTVPARVAIVAITGRL